MKNISKKFAIHMLLLFAAFPIWMIFGHFLRGIAFWIAIAGLTAGLCVTFLCSRDRSDEIIPLDKQNTVRIHLLDIIFHVISILSLLVTMFLSMAGIALDTGRFSIYAGCTVWNSLITVAVSMIWIIASHTSQARGFHGNRLLGINAFALLSVFVLGFTPLTFGVKLTLRKIAIVLSLTGILGSFCTAHFKPEQDNKIALFWGASFLIALMLFVTLNVRLDTSPGEYHSYTAISTGGYRDSATCQMDDGTTFQYSSCPLSQGESWHLYVHEGWFRERYFLEP